MFLRHNPSPSESLTGRDLESCLTLAQDCLRSVRQYFQHDNPAAIDAAIDAVDKAIADLKHR